MYRHHVQAMSCKPSTVIGSTQGKAMSDCRLQNAARRKLWLLSRITKSGIPLLKPCVTIRRRVMLCITTSGPDRNRPERLCTTELSCVTDIHQSAGLALGYLHHNLHHKQFTTIHVHQLDHRFWVRGYTCNWSLLSRYNLHDQGLSLAGG